jgi:hypothetical protein
LWVLDNVQSGLVSGEGLVWSVRDAVYKIENVKEKGRIVGAEEVLADPGVSDKRLLVVEPEFAAVLRVCRRETNTLSPTLRSAWDSGVLRTMAKNSPAKATDAHISIVGHITVEELRGALTEVEGFNGFSNRFLWVAVRRSKLLPDGGREVDLSSYAARLAKALAHARSVGRVRRDPGATALWRTIYSGLANDTSTGLLAAVTSRAEAQVLRLSLIYALIDCSNIIREEHLRAALAVWQYCQGSAKLIFGGIGADPLQDKVLHTIKQHPNGITRWDLHKAVCKHKPAAVLVEKLTRLRDAGLIESKTVTTAGRPAEMWFPLQTRASIVSQGAVSVDEKTTTRTVNGDQGDLEKRDVGETRPQDGGLTSHSSLFSRVDEETARDEGGPFCSTGNDANLPDRGLTSHTSPLSHVEDDTARHEGDPPWPTGSDVSSQDGGLISHTSLFSHVEDEIARDQSESFRPTSDDVKSHGGEVASHTSLISHDEDDFEEVLV